MLLLLGFLLLACRAIYLQGLNNDFLQKKGASRYGRVIELSATRGMITDRNREPLAISTPVESVWASPGDVALEPQQAKQLSKLLDVDMSELGRRLATAAASSCI
jgi:cell division protein FtsI (penicillin-binding protein 3)